jgi:hypothetical protein
MVWALYIDVTIFRTELTANDHPAMENTPGITSPSIDLKETFTSGMMKA